MFSGSGSDLLESFLSEYDKFKESASMKSSLTDTKELISYLKGIRDQIKQQQEKQVHQQLEKQDNDNVSKSSDNYDKLIRAKVNNWQEKVTKTQKQSNNHISRLIKLVDNKVYEFDLQEELSSFHNSAGLRLRLTTKNQNLINQVVLNHVVRECYGNSILAPDKGEFLTDGDAHPEQQLKASEISNETLMRLLEKQFDYTISNELKANLNELKHITDSIIAYDEPDLAPAFEWCRNHEQELKEIESDVEFNLHELQFYLLYYGINKPILLEEDKEEEANYYVNDKQDNSKFSAYIYAKNNFGKFLNTGPRNESKVAIASKLLTSTIIEEDVVRKHYNSNNSKNPYTKMILRNLKNYKSTIAQLVQNFFEINKLNANSNLYLTLMAAYVSLPFIIKFNAVNKKLKRSFSATSRADRSNSTTYNPDTHGSFHQYVNLIRSASMPNQNRAAIDLDTNNDALGAGAGNNEWSSKDELPIGIELPQVLQNKHPIFICPISRQETTKNNPPVLLPCKHIISRESLNNLVESKQGPKRRRRNYRSWLVNEVFAEDEDNDEIDNNGNEYDNDFHNTSDQSYDFSGSSSESEEDDVYDEDGDVEERLIRNSGTYNNSGSNDNNAGQDNSESGARRERSLPASVTPGYGYAENYWRFNSGNRLDSLNQIAFKCPYCPQMCRKNQTKEVFFGTC